MNFSDLHTKLAKEDKFPAYIRIPILILSNWLFQSILYMDKTEKIFKIGLDLILIVFLYFGFANHFALIPCMILSILFAHTFNWIFNGQMFVLLKNLNLVKIDPEYFTIYLKNLQKRIAKEKSILSAAAFGSLSREELKETSDLDMRIIRRQGIVNGFRSCFFVFLERSRAFFNKFPLDIYVLDGFESLKKLRKDEPPVMLCDPNKVLKGIYDKTISFDEIIQTPVDRLKK